jgi:acetoacetyl-CoA synthetase
MSKPLWTPSPERLERANLSRFIRYVQEREHSVEDYPSLYDFSIRDSAAFWRAVWEFVGVRAHGDWEPTLLNGEQMPGAKWFPEVTLNFAQNLLRYKDDRTALIFRSESGFTEEVDYAKLRALVSRCQQALKGAGVVAGDRVAAFMPNRIETVVAMLAASSLGAVFSSCSPDFGAQGVIDRFGQIEPKVLIATDGYFYAGKRIDTSATLNEVLARVASIAVVAVVAYIDAPLVDDPRARRWDDFLATDPAALEFVELPFDHPLYILYSSGTTGAPKCIVHGAGGTLLQHLKELVLHTDLKREDRICYYTTCGWMMWNWLVSSLAVGATVVLYDGSPFHPSGAVLWDLIDELGISVFGTSAKWIAACEKAGLKPIETHKLLGLKTILSTGSPLSPESFEWVYRDVKERVLLSSISGGTDILSCFALGNPLLPVYAGELQCRGLGMAVEILDDDGAALKGEPGELTCAAPFPSMPIGFWRDADGAKYRDAYFARFPNRWYHGDRALRTAHDGLVILGRSDATLNPGGVRIGTAEIYNQVDQVPEVLESLCIGQDWQGDVRVVLFVRLRDGLSLDGALTDRIKRAVRDNLTPRHVPAKIIAVTEIPRTLSGKIVELAVRNVVHGLPVKNLDALANPHALALYRDLPDLQS